MLILLAILAFFVAIIVHEFGHVLGAKWCRVSVPVFCIGFGPRLFEFRLGETLYALNILPLGGFVRIMADPATFTVSEPKGLRRFFLPVSKKEKTHLETLVTKYKNQKKKPSPKQEILILLAGPLASFLLAVTSLWISCKLLEVPEYYQPLKTTVIEGSPLYKAGMRTGDIITHIHGEEIRDLRRVNPLVKEHGFVPIPITFKNPTTQKSTSVTVEMVNVKGDHRYPEFYVWTVGYIPDLKKRPLTSLEAFRRTGEGLLKTGWIFAEYFKDSFSSQERDTKVKEDNDPNIIHSGGIAEQTTQFVSALNDSTRKFFVQFYVFNLFLVILNLLPIPALDGGSALLVFINWKKPNLLKDSLAIAIQKGALTVILVICLGFLLREGAFFTGYLAF